MYKPSEVKRTVISLNNKIKPSGSIPTLVSKDHIDIILPYLTDSINASIHESKFLESLKYANYRSTSFLSSISKILEKTCYAK